MKRMLPILGTLLFAACASNSTTAVPSSSPRYATLDESARLRQEAQANFERTRQQQGTLVVVASGPTVGVSGTTQVSRSRSTSSSRTRTWSAAESRYAMQIGKAPGDLNAGERAAARLE